ncbi:MAG: serine/threonine-protein kinase [Thermoanaerobaculia bacterium]
MTSLQDPRAGDDATEHRPTTDVRPRRGARFTPGTMLAERYRIVALLGSGGMGEVYRAEDTRLGQQVALKFLPHGVHRDPQRLERLFSEVRLGRQVSHPNVCRIYDIGEWEGNHFLAMEYVDGEDLASLLRRIGRLPAQKAFDIARDVCAGIAAAHGLGIVHRDLKPANIMIDGRGQARITDFGLAVVAEELEAGREIAGTPAYMAPEQLSGGTVTHKTDLYALGLVLYEIFTGQRLFDGTDSDARRSVSRTLTGSAASGELDPVIQRVIARCVEEAPEARPSSIHAVIASLPGGDPLQAAVDAGETPSPQMVAAAGEVGDLSPAAAWMLLAGTLAALAVMIAFVSSTSLFHVVPMPKPPDALVDRAKTILETAGYPTAGGDRAYTFDNDGEFYEHMLKNRSRDFWNALPTLRPGVFVFHYRHSPRSLFPGNMEGRVTSTDPPMTEPGMTHVSVDSHGRLLSFVAVPPRQVAGTPTRPVDWRTFFELAGGDFEQMRAVASRWTAPVDTDAKVAWEGRFRGDPTPIRIEAGSYAGKPVWFKVIGPWASTAATFELSGAQKANRLFFALLVPATLIAAIIFARRNWIRGRVDRKLATKLALFVLGTVFVGFLFRADHVSNPAWELRLIDRGIGMALWMSLQIWLTYLALEPYVRRRWPHMLIGWTRLFAGRFRDPMIGRDLLIGLCAGPVLYILRLAAIHAPSWFGEPKLPPFVAWVSPLVATRHLVYAWSSHQVSAIMLGIFILFILLLGFVLLRRRWAAVLVVGAITAFGMGDAVNGPLYELTAGALMAVIIMSILLRFGLLPLIVTLFLSLFLEAVPFTLDPDDWYFGRSLFALALLGVAAIYGFWSSLGEKKALGVPAMEEA